jgi:hypothetical protein
MSLLHSTAALLLTLAVAQAIGPSEASSRVGQQATVCGVVDDARHVHTARRQPTFLNFGGRYPNHQFTAVIFAADRVKFDIGPEVTYLNKRTCVTGVIELYREKPQIIVSEPSQLKLDLIGVR